MAEGSGESGGGEVSSIKESFIPPPEVFELPRIREEFIEEARATLDVGDETKLNGLLLAYELRLAERGLLKGHEPDIHY